MEVLESLIGAVRRCCAGFPDRRTGTNVRYPMPDIGMGAFSLFFVQSPSFLDFQRRLEAGHGRSNCQTLFGMSRIPTDNHIRAMLDPVAPDHLFPVFGEVVAALERSGGLAAFRRLGSHVLIVLDGTEYHRSTRIHCPNCSRCTRAGQPTEHFHTMVCATIVAPGHAQVVPLEPEFIRPQDGHDKQDCESRAVRRWLARHGARYARLDPIYLGDDLLACQPVCEAVLAQGGHFLFTCKPSSHQTIQEYLTGIELDEHVERLRRGRTHATHTYRWPRSTGCRSRSATQTASSPIATASSPICRSRARPWPSSPPAHGRAGRSKTRASTCSRTAATTWSTTSAMASSTSQPYWSASTSWPSPSTPWPTSPRARGEMPARRLVPEPASSTTCRA